LVPKISIVIPVYNSEEFLQECLDSIFSQTLQDFELICVNDGSTDASLQILHDNASQHPNLMLIDQKNGGIGAATNRGIAAATGQYLYSLDNDDTFMDEHVLKYLYETAEENNLDILTFNYTTEAQVTHIKQPDNKIMTGTQYLLGEYIPPLWSKFCRMDYIRSIHFKFLENISFVDTEAVPRLVIDAKRVMHVDKILYKWRREGNNDSSVSQNLKNVKSAHAYAATTLTYHKLYHAAENDALKSAMRKERFKAIIEVTRIAATVNTVESKQIYDELIGLDFSVFEKFLIQNEMKFFYNAYVLKDKKMKHPVIYFFRKVTKSLI